LSHNHNDNHINIITHIVIVTQSESKYFRVRVTATVGFSVTKIFIYL